MTHTPNMYGPNLKEYAQFTLDKSLHFFVNPFGHFGVKPVTF